MGAEQLADYLKRTGAVKSPSVYEAIKAVDRKLFVPESHLDLAYSDQALPIGHGQTISQPFTVALMLEFLEVRPGQKILDVGSGSGWTTALLAHMAGLDGQVTGVERVPGLVKFGQENLAKFHFPWARIVPAQHSQFGLPDQSPFDRILVSAEANEIPDELIGQLASPGILVMPVNGPVIKVRKDKNGNVTRERFKDYLFAFVPLVRQ